MWQIIILCNDGKSALNRNGARKRRKKWWVWSPAGTIFLPEESGGAFSEQKATLKKEYKYRSERKNPGKPTN